MNTAANVAHSIRRTAFKVWAVALVAGFVLALASPGQDTDTSAAG